jgi:hypothetical protein
MDLISDLVLDSIVTHPDVPPSELRTALASSLATVLLERRLQEFQQRATEQLREMLLPRIDEALARWQAASKDFVEEP